MPLPIIRIKPRRPERYGHPWFYDNEIAAVPDDGVVDGDFVTIIDHNLKPLGTGYFNAQSKIAGRLLTKTPDQEIGRRFWEKRIAAAFEYRRQFYRPLPPMYRVVHGEADDLPGLVIDMYGDSVVVQILTLGIERRRDHIIDAIWSVLKPARIYDRSDSRARLLEGMEPQAGLVRGEAAEMPLVIEDAGVKVMIDLDAGAKTGLFLDQRENQIATAKYAEGRRILNCFSYTGLFGLRAALAGAKSVTEVEISAEFNKAAEAQWDLNAPRRCKHETITENAFDTLRRLETEKALYDMVILDPPAFTKSRGQREGAFRGYNDINRRAMNLLPPGGVLVTCSCSHHVDATEFREIVRQSAKDAGRSLRVIEQRGQPADHPVALSVPESEYLKCMILEVA